MIDHQVAGTTVVALTGDFDQSQHDRLDDAFAAALGSSLVVLDLERTRYFDSTVFSCLMRLHKTMLERGGRMVLVRVPRDRSPFARHLRTHAPRGRARRLRRHRSRPDRARRRFAAHRADRRYGGPIAQKKEGGCSPAESGNREVWACDCLCCVFFCGDPRGMRRFRKHGAARGRPDARPATR